MEARLGSTTVWWKTSLWGKHLYEQTFVWGTALWGNICMGKTSAWGHGCMGAQLCRAVRGCTEQCVHGGGGVSAELTPGLFSPRSSSRDSPRAGG